MILILGRSWATHTLTAAAHSQTFKEAPPHCENVEEFTQFDGEKKYIEIKEKELHNYYFNINIRPIRTKKNNKKKKGEKRH